MRRAVAATLGHAGSVWAHVQTISGLTIADHCYGRHSMQMLPTISTAFNLFLDVVRHVPTGITCHAEP